MTGTAAAPRDDGDRAALLAALIEGERGAEPQGSPWLCQSVTDGTDAEPILAT